MKPRHFIPLLLLAVVVMSTSCKKNDAFDPTQPLSFISLIAANDTISVGETTTITATAMGENLTYSWKLDEGSLGDIIGGGTTITYGASPCCTGVNTITCTISDGINTESKSVTIVVEEL